MTCIVYVWAHMIQTSLSLIPATVALLFALMQGTLPQEEIAAHNRRMDSLKAEATGKKRQTDVYNDAYIRQHPNYLRQHHEILKTHPEYRKRYAKYLTPPKKTP